MADDLTIEAADILAEELARITPEMLVAGSEAANIVSAQHVGGGKTMPRQCTEAEYLTAIYHAMLAARLR